MIAYVELWLPTGGMVTQGIDLVTEEEADGWLVELLKSHAEDWPEPYDANDPTLSINTDT